MQKRYRTSGKRRGNVLTVPVDSNDMIDWKLQSKACPEDESVKAPVHTQTLTLEDLPRRAPLSFRIDWLPANAACCASVCWPVTGGDWWPLGHLADILFRKQIFTWREENVSYIGTTTSISSSRIMHT